MGRDAGGRVRQAGLEGHGAAARHLEDVETLERPDAGEHEGLRTGELDDRRLGIVVHHRGVVQLYDVEQLAVPVVGGADLHQRQLPGHAVPGRERGGLANAYDLLQMLDRAVGRRFVGLNHDRDSRDAGGHRGAHGDAPDGQVSPPDQSDGTVEGDETVLEQHRHGARVVDHAVTASDSIGSLSDAPGGIIGNTLASCSMRNSTSAGPSCAERRAQHARPPARRARPAIPGCRTPRPAARSRDSRWAWRSSGGRGRTAATAAPCRGSRC